jgi:hypothetical protein
VIDPPFLPYKNGKWPPKVKFLSQARPKWREIDRERTKNRILRFRERK